MHFNSNMGYECVKSSSEYHRNDFIVLRAYDFMRSATEHKSFQFNNLEINHRAILLHFHPKKLALYSIFSVGFLYHFI